MDADKSLREHLLYLLGRGGAHIGIDTALEGFPVELAGRKVPGIDHTAWQLLEHMRIAQWDILEFVRNPQHVSPQYPSGYWPKEDGPQDPAQWGQTVDALQRDLQDLMEMVRNPEVDLHARIPHGSGQTLIREALLAADHNSYHIGQMVDLRMLLDVRVRDW